jgi:hypothetical protein
MPVLSQAPQVKTFTLLLVHQFGNRRLIYSSSPTAKAALDSAPPQPVPVEGLSFNDVAPGPHQVVFEDNGVTRPIPLAAREGIAIQAFLLTKADPEKGSILVVTGEDNVEIAINNYPFYRKTQGGQVRLPAIPPGNYKITVKKEGFEVPAAQPVEVKKGEEARVQFTLRAVVSMATLQVQGPAGAQVFSDGQLLGVIGGDGQFTAQLTPGVHALELRRNGARSRAYQADLKPGASLTLGPSELALQSPNGTVRFEVAVSGATLLLRRQGEPGSAARPLTQNPASLPEGNYILTASAPQHESSSISFSVAPGAASTVNVSLRPLRQEGQPAAPESVGFNGFENPTAWSSEGGWMIRRGGRSVLFRTSPTGGVFHFEIQLRRGKRLQWMLHYQSPQNHLLFRLDKRTFTRVEEKAGKSKELASSSHPLGASDTYEIRITVEPDRIVHEGRVSGNWVVIDTHRASGNDLTAGRFGFVVPDTIVTAADIIAVRNFTFQPRSR